MSSTRYAGRLAGLALAIALVAPVGAVPFNLGGLEGQFDSRLDLEAAWATARADRGLIGALNGGRAPTSFGDDGRLNFKRGETFEKRFVGDHSLELRYRDSGLFLRGQYWYDFEAVDEARLFRDLDQHGRRRGTRASGGQLLETFIYHNYRIDTQPGALHLGRQVLHWGEARLLAGGIDVINPQNTAAQRRAGGDPADQRLPLALLHLAQQLDEQWALEAFYPLEWRADLADNCGTFFAGNDYLADGCSTHLAVLQPRATLDEEAAELLRARGVAWGEPDEGVLLRRAGDRHARDDGQFGLALRYYHAALDAEFGAYLIRYHSRSPVLGAMAAVPAAFVGVPAELVPLVAAGRTEYRLDYPQDIRLYGLSVATTRAGGTQWRGELAYRANAPLALNGAEVLAAAMQSQAGAGDVVGYRRKEMLQLVAGFSQVFDNVMGASRLTLDGELGWVHVAALESPLVRRYGRDPLFGPGPGAAGGCAGHYCEYDGFVTRDAWGYRLHVEWLYEGALGAIDMRPWLAWGQDVRGHSPEAVFVEGRQAVSLGLTADYRGSYSASLVCTDFSGGRYSTLGDRDFLAFSVGVRF